MSEAMGLPQTPNAMQRTASRLVFYRESNLGRDECTRYATYEMLSTCEHVYSRSVKEV